VSETCQAVQAGQLDAGAAAETIHARLRAADFVPPEFGLADPQRQCIDATPAGVLRMLRWAKTDAPPEIGKLTYDGLTLFMKKRFARGEFPLGEEIKHAVAGRPLLGRRLRVPSPDRY
jgi:FADH2 O2-dependent halogenase